METTRESVSIEETKDEPENLVPVATEQVQPETKKHVQPLTEPESNNTETTEALNEPSAPNESATPIEPSAPNEPPTPIDPSAPNESATPIELSAPNEPAAPINSPPPNEPSAPNESATPIEPSAPNEPAAPINSPAPNDPITPIEPPAPFEAAVVEQTTSSETIGSNVTILSVEVIPTETKSVTANCVAEDASSDMDTNSFSHDAKETPSLTETTTETQAPFQTPSVQDEDNMAPHEITVLSQVSETPADAMETDAVVVEGSQPISVTEEIVPNIVESTPRCDDGPIKTSKAPSKKGVQTGLALLAQYDSDCDSDEHTDTANEPVSDSESVIEVPAVSANDYRHQVVEIESDSDNSDTEDLGKLRKVIEKRIGTTHAAVDYDDDDDDDEGGAGGRGQKRQPPKVKGEMLLDELPPIQDLQITVPEEECVELGRVHSIVDQLVLVSVLPDSILLDLDTVLFLERGKRVLGEVFDVLGQVADPLYCVRFNTHEHIEERAIAVGDVVYVAPKTQYTQFVILSSLMKVRGSDASWENDVEPPPRYIDYSDDEEERTARAQLRNKNRPSDHDDPTKRARSDAIPSTSIAAANERPTTRPYRHQQQHYQRGGSRGGRGNYRMSQYNEARGFHPPNYNASSWHSNYFVPLRQAPAPPPSSYYHQPPPQFNPYGPPRHHMPPPPSLPMYVLNPYAIRPPVLPPPPPPPPPQPPGTD